MWKNKHYSSESNNNIICTKCIWTGQRLLCICACCIIEVVSQKNESEEQGNTSISAKVFLQRRRTKKKMHKEKIAYLSLLISFTRTDTIFVQLTVGI